MKKLVIYFVFMCMVLAPVIKGYGQDFDLSTCNFGCTSNDITILGFSLVDATTGLPVFNSISECQDGDTFQVKLEMNYSFNTAATRVNARFQGKLKFGLTEIFIDEYVGEFSSAANGGSGKMII